jgi:PAS domain S-box-containing protein
LPVASADDSPAGVDLRARVVELERVRELLNAIANHAPSLLCLVDAEGRVRPSATNVAFERTLGYGPGESGGDLFWERYVPEDDSEDVQEIILQTIAGGPVSEQDGRWVTNAGELVDVAWSCTPLPMIDDGQLYLICGTDITERKRHEDEVRLSRTRIVTAADEARRRLERDLHDGAQQRLVALLLSLRATRKEAADNPALLARIDAAIDELAGALHDLRELARGIHPVALTRRGLPSALRLAADRTPVPVELSVPTDRYEEAVEKTAYYVVVEALTNIAKYARASAASVRIEGVGGRLVVEVEDDGVGGADAEGGSGLRGLADRIAALDGSFTVESASGSGTRIRAEIPLGGA